MTADLDSQRESLRQLVAAQASELTALDAETAQLRSQLRRAEEQKGERDAELIAEGRRIHDANERKLLDLRRRQLAINQKRVELSQKLNNCQGFLNDNSDLLQKGHALQKMFNDKINATRSSPFF